MFFKVLLQKFCTLFSLFLLYFYFLICLFNFFYIKLHFVNHTKYKKIDLIPKLTEPKIWNDEEWVMWNNEGGQSVNGSSTTSSIEALKKRNMGFEINGYDEDSKIWAHQLCGITYLCLWKNNYGLGPLYTIHS